MDHKIRTFLTFLLFSLDSQARELYVKKKKENCMNLQKWSNRDLKSYNWLIRSGFKTGRFR